MVDIDYFASRGGAPSVTNTMVVLGQNAPLILLYVYTPIPYLSTPRLVQRLKGAPAFLFLGLLLTMVAAPILYRSTPRLVLRLKGAPAFFFLGLLLTMVEAPIPYQSTPRLVLNLKA